MFLNTDKIMKCPKCEYPFYDYGYCNYCGFKKDSSNSAQM